MSEVREPVGGQEVLAPDRRKRYRKDGWNPRKKQRFLEALTHKASLTEAAASVDLSMVSVRNLRRRDSEFDRACHAALAAVRPSLMEAAYQRGVLGVDEPVFQGGRLIGTKRRYSDGMLRLLIDRDYDPTVAPAPLPGRTALSDEEVTQRLLRRLDALITLEGKKQRAAQLAWCERMGREGKAP